MANGDKYYVHFQATGTVNADHSGIGERDVELHGRHREAQGPDRQGHLHIDDAADGPGTADVQGEYKTP